MKLKLWKKLSEMSSAAVRALSLEYKSLLSDPVEGFRVKLVKDDHLFNWEVGLYGPPTTLYEGGYFKVRNESKICRKMKISRYTRTFPLHSSALLLSVSSLDFSSSLSLLYAVCWIGFAFLKI